MYFYGSVDLQTVPRLFLNLIKCVFRPSLNIIDRELAHNDAENAMAHIGN